jgi:hypothetical protein
MKLLHNKLIGKILAATLGIACAVYFGWTFSFFAYWLANSFINDSAISPHVAAWIGGSIMFLAVIFVFFYIEYSKEDVDAYSEMRGDWSFSKAVRQARWAILAVELGSLLFRLIQLQFAPVGIAMVAIGLALLYLAHIFGKILHAQVNVPLDVEAGRVREDAGRKALGAVRRGLDRITNADDLRRIHAGDFTPIDKVKAEDEHDRDNETAREKARQREIAAKRDSDRQATQDYLKPREKASSNGHGPF